MNEDGGQQTVHMISENGGEATFVQVVARHKRWQRVRRNPWQALRCRLLLSGATAYNDANR
jgi:hypothetical protein